MLEKDANKDGKIDLKEYLGETYDQPNSEWFATEKVRFQEEYDKNNNGFLEGEELKVWLIPDLKETSKQEADHLLESADTDKVKRLRKGGMQGLFIFEIYVWFYFSGWTADN